MILLNVAELTKRYGPEPVLDGVTFEVRPGERIALVGPNGTGKSTLLKVIAGLEDFDTGRLERHDSARIGYLEQHPEFDEATTLWEVAASGMAELIALGHEAESVAHALSASTDEAERQRLAARYDKLQQELHHRDAYQLDHKIVQVLEGLGFRREQFDQPARLLSGGQQNRVLLAKLLLTGSDLLLLDEPSNHLDIEATEWLEKFLTEGQQALIVVSHDRYFLDRVALETLELFHGTVDRYPGNFSKYWELKAERLKVQQRTYEKQREEIAKTEDFIRKNHYGQKSAQAKDREKKLARIERVDLPREIIAPPMGLPAVERCGDIVLRVEELSKGYDRPLFQGLTFTIERGQRWGILGPNGTGKTTLLKCLVGKEKPNAGRYSLGTGVQVGYYDQMLTLGDESQPALEAVRPPGVEMHEPQRRDLLARFGLKGEIVFQPISSLSGGERSRAALARLSGTTSNFLVLDEPTNHLDLWARDALERSLKAYEGTVLFVSHDRYFLNRVADHLLVVEPHRFRVIEGNYDTYLHFVAQGLAGPGSDRAAKSDAGKTTASDAKSAKADAAGKAKPDKPAGDGSKKRRKFPYRKVEEIEAEIFEREAAAQSLSEALCHPDNLRDGRKLKEIQTQIDDLQLKLAELYAHWEEATELNW